MFYFNDCDLQSEQSQLETLFGSSSKIPISLKSKAVN